MLKHLLLISLLFLSLETAAQSGRAAAQVSQTSEQAAAFDRPVKDLFDEANAYNRTKFAEFEAKKIRYSEALEKQTEREKKQLAAKFAAQVRARKELKGDDLYYLGLLDWIAENLEGTLDSLRKYVAAANATADKLQRSRSVIAFAEAKRGGVSQAVAAWDEYQKNEPQKLTEISRMANEIAKAFIAAKDFAKAAPFALKAYQASKTLSADVKTRGRALDEMVDAGMLVFETYREQSKTEDAETILTDMQTAAAQFGSPSFFFYASDKLIVYQIETGRKPLAMETYLTALMKAGRDLPLKGQQTDATDRLRRREKQYRLLQEPAMEFLSDDKWFPGERRTLGSLKGKVVLLDFWATWCTPCFDAFPHLSDWSRDYAADGLVVLGLTRYYGQMDGFTVDQPNEIDILKQFRIKQKLPYDFVVFGDQQTQMAYAATGLPTAVMIDRKGKIRYIESGTSTTRLEDMRQMIIKLLAEK